MEPVHIVTIVLGVAGMYFGGSMMKAYLEHCRQIREHEIKSDSERQLLSNMRFASEEETKRVRLITDLARKDYRIDNLMQYAHDAHTGIVKAASSADEAEIQGVQVSVEA